MYEMHFETRFRRKCKRGLIVIGGASMIFHASSNIAFASPSDDDIADATPIASLPFTQATNVAYATGGYLEPVIRFDAIRTARYSFTVTS